MGVVVSSKSDLVVPRSVRRRAGLRSGQKVEFKVSGGVIHIIPELPLANDEYTPAQRRIINDRLRQARKGPYHGPFATADEAIAFVRREVRRRRQTKRAP
jgi:bifunctional DNA-binding transcriptional regulator/antitoxin component of YhaV-PrlF toxin-antitoxin module